jgi:CheY-like chemotaxis protein
MRLVAGQSITALVVDDHSINRRIMAILLESMGVQTITAASGTEGIDLARRHRPEVILMDLRMKGMDGIEATHRLQAERATASIPVLAITASPFEGDRDAALAAGCREFLAKPVRAADLIGALERQLGVRFERVVVPVSTVEDQVNDLQTSAALAVVAERLREATAIGSISDLHAIALELIQGGPQQARLGHRITRLVDQFEFDAIEKLASEGQISDDLAAKS